MRRARYDRTSVLVLVFLTLYVPFVFRAGYRLAREHHTDFPTFYFAARAALKVGLSPYQQTFATGFRPSGGVQQYVFPYLYPPPSLLLFYPHTWFGYETAKRLQLGLSHLALLTFLFVVTMRLLGLRAHRPRDAIILGACFAVTFLFAPLDVALKAGQTNVVATLAIVGAWYGMSRHRNLVSGLGLAVAGLLKTYPLLLVVLLIVRRRWSAVGWTFGSLAALVAWAWWALPRSAWSDWWTQVLPNARYGSTPEGLGSVIGPWNQSVAGFTSRLFVPNEFCEALLPSAILARIVPYVAALTLTGVTVYATLRSMRHAQPASDATMETQATETPRNDSQQTLSLQVGAFLLLTFMVAPISWEHHLVFVLPSLYVALAALHVAQRPSMLAVLLLCATLLAVPFPIQYDSFPGIAPWLQSGLPTLLVSTKLFAVGTVWLLLVSALWKPSALPLRK